MGVFTVPESARYLIEFIAKHLTPYLMLRSLKAALGLVVCLHFLAFAGCSRQNKTERALSAGRKFFDAGEYEKAKISCLGVLRLDGENREAFKRVGLIWSAQGANFEAARFLTKARQLDPQDIEVRTKLASALLNLHQFAAARAEAAIVLDQDAQQVDALLVLAESARSEEEVQELNARLQKANPDSLGALITKAGLALRKDDRLGAQMLLEKALVADPKSSLSHSAMGTLAMMRKDPARAEVEFQQAAALAPRSPASLAYAQFLLQKDPKAAADFFTEFEKIAGDYLPIWILRARVAVNGKESTQALAHLDRVFQIDVSNYEARLLQAQVLMGDGDTDKAIDQLKKLSEDKFYARVPLPRFELARAYLQKSNPSQAMASLSDALAIQPDFRDAVLLQAQLKLQQGDAQFVVDSMKAFLQKNPNVLQAQLLLSEAYRSQGNLVDAARVLQEQIQVEPTSPEPHLMLGLIQLQQGRNAEARQAFEEVRKLSPNNLLAAYHLTELDLAEKKFEDALQRAQRLCTEMPKAPGPLFVLSRVYTVQENWDGAEQALKKSISLDANFIIAYDQLVKIYVRTNKLKEARQQTEAFVSLNPDNAGGLLTLAAIEERLQNSEKARDIYQKVVAGNPNSAAALNNLAVIYAEKLQQLDKAYEFASRARTVQPDSGAIADTLGWIAYRRQDYQQAFALLQEAAGKLPENSEVQYHFGMASYMTGQIDTARLVLTKAAAAAEDFPGKSEISRALAMIQGAGGTSGKEMSTAELEATLQQHPNDIVVRQRLAETLEKGGAFPRSAALWEEALKANPKLLPATIKLARLYAGPLRDPAKALDYARKARALAPNDPEVAGLAGQAAFQRGDFTWAYGLLRDAARQPKPGVGVLHDLALTSYNLGKVDEARQLMQQALDTMPAAPDTANVANVANAPQLDSAKQFLFLTALQDRPDEIAAAEPRIREVLKVNPTDVSALMLQAALLTGQKQPAKAIETYQGILGRLPDFGPAQKRLAVLYLNQPDQASAAFEWAAKARKNLPEDLEVARTLAILRYQRKEYATVVQLLGEVSARQPLDPSALFYQGMSRLRIKQNAEGYADLSKALEAGLTGPSAEDATRELAAREKSTPR